MKISQLVNGCAFLVWVFESAIEFLKECFKVISVPTKVQTKQGLCLIIKCQWIQFELGNLNNNGDEVKWLYAFGWQNLKILNAFHQICQTSWFVVPCGCIMETDPKDVKTWLLWKWTMDSWRGGCVFFGIFLWTIINSSMDITTSSFDTNMVSKQ